MTHFKASVSLEYACQRSDDQWVEMHQLARLGMANGFAHYTLMATNGSGS